MWTTNESIERENDSVVLRFEPDYVDHKPMLQTLLKPAISVGTTPFHNPPQALRTASRGPKLAYLAACYVLIGQILKRGVRRPRLHLPRNLGRAVQPALLPPSVSDKLARLCSGLLCGLPLLLNLRVL